jgi:hypothetical protein
MQQFLDREIIRKQEFEGIWEDKLDDVFLMWPHIMIE